MTRISTRAAHDADPAALKLLFAEINEHLRSNDAKHLQISIGYFGLLAIALSIIASGSGFVVDSWAHLLAYSILVTVGCITVFMQDSYRAWKIHYRVRLHWIAKHLRLDDQLLPHWIAWMPYSDVHAFRLSPDNALTYFTAATTLPVTIILEVSVISLVEPATVAVLVASVSAAIYLACIGWIRWRGLARKKRVLDEIDYYERFEPSRA